MRSIEEIEGADNLSYEEYLEIMRKSAKDARHYFESCFYDVIGCQFKGRVEKVRKEYICVQRIFISGVYSDGTGFEGKEDHVWIKRKGLEQFKKGDCISFEADVYRYLKKGAW